MTNDHTARALADHVLTPICVTDAVEVWRMAKPGSRAYATQLAFTPEGIAIQGDICFGPSNHGLCSALGYGVDWFSGQLAPAYLCEKFLHKDWQSAVGAARLRASLADEYAELSDEHRAAIEELLDHGDDDNLTPDDVYSSLHEFDEECGQLFWAYDPSDVNWLVAVQKRFAHLYHQTLNEVLTERGFNTRPASQYGAKEVLKGDDVVFTGRAGEVWAWLRGAA